MKHLLLLIVSLFTFVRVADINAATFVVTTTADSGPGSLRQAILDANAMSGYDVINFAIPGTGVQTITPLSELPWITDTITINGFSQINPPKGPPPIELNGSLTTDAAGLVLYNTSNSFIRGLVINRFGTGLILSSGSCGHTIKSNYIGTDPSGTTALGNNFGVDIFSCPNNQIGVGGKNVISGNNIGINISESPGNVVQGNYVGTDVTGTQIVGNMLAGIAIDHSSNTTIGYGNVITGGQVGVQIEYTTGTSVLGNFFCTEKTGTFPLGDLGYGLFIRNSSSNNIGDVTPGAGNVIACSSYKVFVDSGIDNPIRGNSMYSSIAGNLGIDLAPAGITPNDFRDHDTGPNNLQNFPYLNDAVNNGPTTIIFGALSSSFITQFVIDFYSSPSCSQRGAGDGKTYLGSINVATSGRLTTVDFQTSLPVTVPVGHVITATATTLGGINNTSEFSNCAEVHYPD